MSDEYGGDASFDQFAIQSLEAHESRFRPASSLLKGPAQVSKPPARPESHTTVAANVGTLRPAPSLPPLSNSTRNGAIPTSPPKQLSPQKINRPGFNAVIVNVRQKGNPILEHVRNVPWEYGEIEPDFVIGATSCALFLSLKYHRLHPEYIYNRMGTLGKQYKLRVLLIMVDIDNHSDSLRELTKTSIVNNFPIICAWSAAEAGRYLESYKVLENSAPTQIREKEKTSYGEQIVEVLTSIRGVNKTDAHSLIANFGSFADAIAASPEQIQMVGGWGGKKTIYLKQTVEKPFSVKGTTSKRRQEEILTQTAKRVDVNPEPSFRAGKDVTSYGTIFGEAAPEALADNHVPVPARAGPSSPLFLNDDDDDDDDVIETSIAPNSETSLLPSPKPLSQTHEEVIPAHRGVLAHLAKLREAAS